MANPLRPTDEEEQAPPDSKAKIAAALLGFGAQMMQPPGWGQSSWGNFGQAIGTAGQSAANVGAQELKAQEAGSKEELRSAQAEAAGQKASAQGVQAQRAADLAAYQRGQLEAEQRRAGERETSNTISEYLKYQGLVDARNKELAEENRKARLMGEAEGEQPKPPMLFNEWVTAYRPGQAAKGTPSAPAAPGVVRPSPAQADEIKRHVIQYPQEEVRVRTFLDQKYGPGSADAILGKRK